MSPVILFNIHLVFGYLACLLCFRMYFWPRLKAMDGFEAQRIIATIHSFRFFGLVFLLPGVVGPNLPASFATGAAYGDFVTGVLALVALVAVRKRLLFWTFAIAFNVIGTADLLLAYYRAVRIGLPALAGQLGAAYGIVVIYVPALMITHIGAFYLLLRSRPKSAIVGNLVRS